MNVISELEIAKLAKLARIGLSKEEEKSLASQMSEILDYASELDMVDVSNVVPTSQVTGLMNVTRIDKVVGCDIGREDLLANAPAEENGFIKVKKVL